MTREQSLRKLPDGWRWLEAMEPYCPSCRFDMDECRPICICGAARDVGRQRAKSASDTPDNARQEPGAAE